HFTCLPSRGEIAVAANTRLVASKTTAATSPNGKYDRDRWPTTPLRRSRSTPENALHGGGHRGGMVGGGRRDAGVGGSAPPDASPRSMGSTADGSADAAGHGAHVHGGRCRRVVRPHQPPQLGPLAGALVGVVGRRGRSGGDRRQPPRSGLSPLASHHVHRAGRGRRRAA